MPVRKRMGEKTKAYGFQISQPYGSFSNEFMTVKGSK